MKQHRIIRILFPAVFYLLVWIAAWRLIGQELLLPGPAAVFSRFSFLASASFWTTVAYTLMRTMAAYLGGIVIAFLLALLSHGCGWAEMLIQPLMTVVRATPVASFIILALVWLSSRTVPVFAGVLMVVPVVYASVREGLNAVHPQLLEMTRVYGWSRFKTLRHVSLPSLLPAFLSSCEACVGLCFKATVAAEVIGLPRNAIGTQLHNTKIYLETDGLMAWTIIVILLSLLLEKLLRVLFGRWMRHAHHG